MLAEDSANKHAGAGNSLVSSHQFGRISSEISVSGAYITVLVAGVAAAAHARQPLVGGRWLWSWHSREHSAVRDNHSPPSPNSVESNQIAQNCLMCVN